ncbi:ferredoxin [Nocardia alni]|uniref:ferredoxin n=1 Tax=Nocardia alni TaxID=2815723 RepID=UPI001C24E20B|nr:ferredoxin [Nocardia alni]
MRIEVNRARCEGHGLCAGAAPALLRLDDDGELVVGSEDVTDAAHAEAAVRVCPVAALRLDDGADGPRPGPGAA